MKLKCRTYLELAVTLSLVSMNFESALACGPFAKAATFVNTTNPDFPLRRFAAGQLGIIRPDYARSYLVVAYRYLSGIKTSPEKQKEINALWEHRLTSPDGKLQNAVEQWSAERKKVLSAPLKDVEVYKWDQYSYAFVNYNADAFTVATDTLKGKIAKFGINDKRVKEWVIAQDRVFGVNNNSSTGSGGEAPPPKALEPLPADADAESRADRNYQIACSSFYEGNYDDAIDKFQEIAKDSSSRWQPWGNYLAARAYCRKATKEEKPELADLKKAKELIDTIVNSKDQSMVQKAQAIKHFIEYRLDPSSRAKEAVTALASDGENANLTEALGDYTVILDRILEKSAEAEQPTTWNGGNSDNEVGSAPEDKTTQTASNGRIEQSSATSGNDVLFAGAALAAFVFTGTHLLWWRPKSKGSEANWLTTIAVFVSVSILSCSIAACAQKADTPAAVPNPAVVAKEVPADSTIKSASQVVLDDDMSNWILNFQDKSPQAVEKAMSEWQKSKSLPWLVSVMTRIQHTNARKDEVLAAVDKVPADSPAYFTLAYHRIRLLNDAGKTSDAASALMSVIKENSDKLPPSARNSFYELGVGIAATIADFAKLSAPSPACVSLDIDYLPDPIEDLEKAERANKYLAYPGCLTRPAANIINEIAPISTMIKLANDETLPAKVRADIAQAGWVRSVMLKDEKAAMTLSPVLGKLQPQLSKSLSTFDTASSGDEKEFAALSVILHNPAMRPYVTIGLPRETAFNKIDNYRDNWWCADPPLINHGYDESGERKKDPTPAVAFLTAEEKTQGLKQYTDLKTLGTAPNLFARRILKLAKAKPKDPRFPEVLHLVVTSTRYGCTDDSTTPLSKQVFQELHKNYPGNPWTKKTKFWF